MNTATTQLVSVVLPAKNEAEGLRELIPKIQNLNCVKEIIVVNDGSTDETKNIALKYGVIVLSHPYSMGNGAAIKTGARAATGDTIIFMDSDGQHSPDDIPRLIEKMNEGYEMVVGARELDTHASIARRIANTFYNRLASIMTGHEIKDLTSGFRAVRTRHFKRFLYLLPNGFSYPTTSTMAFFRSALPVAYIPIRAAQRQGKSNINPLKDGVRFFLIILKVGALFSPMRLFLPISAVLFTIGCSHYAYTYINMNRFTNMSALLFISSIFTFLMGIISEQISALHYKDSINEHRRVIRDKKNSRKT